MTHDSQTVFKALADPTRRAIVALLAEQERTVGEVARHFAMTRPAVAKHLSILEAGGLISVRSKGRERINRLEGRALEAVSRWVAQYDRFWDARLATLKTLVEEEMTAARIVKTVFLKATPETVWSYLTEADKLGRWFHRAEADLTDGETYRLLSDDPKKREKPLIWGAVVSMDKPRKLVWTFTHDHLQGVETEVIWTLETVAGGTVLTLVHDGFDRAPADLLEMLTGHDAGWDEHFVKLRTVVAGSAEKAVAPEA